MDGNGRWATQRNHQRTFGHIRGAQKVRDIVEIVRKKDVEFLTLYAFSTENWRRPVFEIEFLMRLLRRYLDKEAANLHQEGIRFNFIGDVKALPEMVQDRLVKTAELTKDNRGMTLTLALNYGSRQEIIGAVKEIAKDVKDRRIEPQMISEGLFENYLKSSALPDPDLLIRTSGESRLSNFLLWQISYTELYFTNVLWPDFTEAELDKALEAYARRDRRFGSLESQSPEINNQTSTVRSF
jgi:undecaprenyl diphosphate synthase